MGQKLCYPRFHTFYIYFAILFFKRNHVTTTHFVLGRNFFYMINFASIFFSTKQKPSTYPQHETHSISY